MSNAKVNFVPDSHSGRVIDAEIAERKALIDEAIKGQKKVSFSYVDRSHSETERRNVVPKEFMGYYYARKHTKHGDVYNPNGVVDCLYLFWDGSEEVDNYRRFYLGAMSNLVVED